MNREIKFRAWDKREKKMCEADFFDNFYVINQGRVGIIKGDVFDDGSSYYVDYSDKNNWEVMQYTGLKDKNEKEIYEEDIIKSGNGALGVVKWRYFGFEQDMINTLGWWVIQEDGEVIGNIYETPELLQ